MLHHLNIENEVGLEILKRKLGHGYDDIDKMLSSMEAGQIQAEMSLWCSLS